MGLPLYFAGDSIMAPTNAEDLVVDGQRYQGMLLGYPTLTVA
jgi:hypothetical protein